MKVTFEDKLKKLQEITANLESGEKSLEESVSLYTEGMKLVAGCQKDLDSAKLKIEKYAAQPKEEEQEDATE